MNEKSFAILKHRAELLAKPIKETDLNGNCLEIVVFKLSQENYGVETHFIKEVSPLKEYTTLPSVPPFIFGLMNIRSRIVPLIDLKFFFDLPVNEDAQKKIIVLMGEEKEFGIVADSVVGIKKISVDQIQPTMPTLTGVKEDFLRGITLDRIIILDGKKLLSSSQLQVDETV